MNVDWIVQLQYGYYNIVFNILKVLWYLIGIRKGLFVKSWSESKHRYIVGVIIGIEYELVKRNSPNYSFHVRWLEPLQGHNSNVYVNNWYDFKAIVDMSISAYNMLWGGNIIIPFDGKHNYSEASKYNKKLALLD